MTRGASWVVDKFKGALEGQWYPLPNSGALQGKRGQKHDANISVVMRPVQLWEAVFPKEALPSVLKTITTRAPLKPKKERKWAMKEWARQNKFIFAMRKVLNLKPIPKDLKETGNDMTDKERLVDKFNLDVIPIGIREDVMGNAMEML